jgi:uroporphyrinogen III methyltransferase/synthase
MLKDRTVVITRSEENADELARALEALGAFVLSVPAIRNVEVDNGEVLKKVLREKSSYSHLVFASPQAVRFFFDASCRRGVPISAWRAVRIAGVGPRTSAALEEAGLKPHLVARGKGGTELARELLEKERLGPGSRVLLPQSAIARPELRDLLEAAGIAVDAVTIYDTVPERPEKLEPFFSAIDAGRAPDAILFTSPSTLKSFLVLSGERGAAALRQGIQIVSIGATTSSAIRGEGLSVAAEAKSPSVEGLVEAVVLAVGG